MILNTTVQEHSSKQSLPKVSFKKYPSRSRQLFSIKWLRISFPICRSVKLHLFFYKQLGSGLSFQSCFYFQGFWGSKLLNSCFVVWSSNLCLRGKQSLSRFKSIFMSSDFKIFPIMILRQLNCGVLSVWQLFYVYYKGKTPLFFNL